MTKRITIGALCVVLSLLLAISGWFYMKSVCEKLITAGETALASYDSGTFFQLAQNALNEWEKRDKLVSVFIKHDDADRVDGLYLTLKSCINEKNSEMTAYYLRLCVSEIRVLFMGEKPGVENVF